MQLADIHIRDPFILLDEDVYYLYGTTVFWGNADNFICYRSKDLKDWVGPVEIFRRSEDFWADRCFWAPECHKYGGRFYFMATMGSEQRKKGIQLLVSDRPDQTFTPVGQGPVTPASMTCIDGTLYEENGVPYLIFSHSFEDGGESAMCAVPMKADLSGTDGDIFTLFYTKEAPWAKPFPNGREEFSMDQDVYFSDGPYLHRTGDGTLLMLWSSWGGQGYTVGTAASVDGTLHGTWRQYEEPLLEGVGGHGMIFSDTHGKTYYIIHSPNDISKERPYLYELIEKGGRVVLKEAQFQ